MSTIKVAASKHAASSIDYALYGDSGRMRAEHLAAGTSRVAAFRSSLGGEASAWFRDEFVAAAEDHGRKNQLYMYTLSFHPDEFDVSNPTDLDRIAEVGEKLCQRMHSADYAVVVHADAKGGHGHAHIYVVNHDNVTGKSLQKYTSWQRGVRQLNDELMRDEGLQQLPDPHRQLEDWTLRREQFAADGFERELGDRIATALRDPRSTDRDSFAAVLGEQDVRVSVARSGELRYKMRHPTSGRLMSKSGAKLTPEFTTEGVRQIFDYRAQQQAEKGQQEHGHPRRDQAEREPQRDFGAVAAVDVTAGRARKRSAEPDRRVEPADRAADRDRQVGVRRDQPGEDGAAVNQKLVRARIAAERRRKQAQRDREDAERARGLDQLRGHQPGGPECSQRRSQGRGLGL
ncbi:relaxase/mobilization nuclease domain-containing protein [Gordonia paraffinivorans]|nr:relaxase/mobilization nuclease domain-containing protein [Gordonia paraffinivorans]